MDDANDLNIIVNSFEEKFKSIFVDNKCQTVLRNYNQNIKDLVSKLSFRILDYTIVNAINSLNDY